MFAISKLVDWVGGFQADANNLPNIPSPDTTLAEEVLRLIEYEEPEE
jgi:hypothetical protein